MAWWKVNREWLTTTSYDGLDESIAKIKDTISAQVRSLWEAIEGRRRVKQEGGRMEGEDWVRARRKEGGILSERSRMRLLFECEINCVSTYPQGPFDGILGFSQGGVFAAILSTMATALGVRFFMIFSAFTPSDAKVASYFSQNESER